MPTLKGVFVLQDIREEQLAGSFINYINSFGFITRISQNNGGYKLSYASNTVSAFPISNNTGWSACLSDNTTMRECSGAGYSTINKLSYSSGSSFTPINTLLVVRTQESPSTLSDGSSGWFLGGTLSGSALSSVEKIIYDSDTIATQAKGSLAISAASFGATGRGDFGFLIGGRYSGTTFSSSQKITYSNDTVVPVLRGTAPTTYGATGAVTNKLFAWTLGGYSYSTGGYISTTHRLDYSNDTASLSARTPLTVAKSFMGSSINDSYGYVYGGQISGPSFVTTVERINLSNDTLVTNISTMPAADAGQRFGGNPATNNCSFN